MVEWKRGVIITSNLIWKDLSSKDFLYTNILLLKVFKQKVLLSNNSQASFNSKSS